MVQSHAVDMEKCGKAKESNKSQMKMFRSENAINLRHTPGIDDIKRNVAVAGMLPPKVAPCPQRYRKQQNNNNDKLTLRGRRSAGTPSAAIRTLRCARRRRRAPSRLPPPRPLPPRWPPQPRGLSGCARKHGSKRKREVREGRERATVAGRSLRLAFSSNVFGVRGIKSVEIAAASSRCRCLMVSKARQTKAEKQQRHQQRQQPTIYLQLQERDQ